MPRTFVLAFAFGAGCATTDVLHSEHLVIEGECSGKGIGVFGLPDDDACGAAVISLGNGCYVANRRDARVAEPRAILVDGTPWNPSLYECAANGPGHHVACIRAEISPFDPPIGTWEDVIFNYWAAMDSDGVLISSTNRCIDRFVGFEAELLPKPPPIVAELYSNELGDDGFFATVRAEMAENGWELNALVGAELEATVCPDAASGVRAELATPHDARITREITAMIERLYAEALSPLDACVKRHCFLRTAEP